MAAVSERSWLSVGLAVALAGTVFTAGGAYVRLEALDARMVVAEARVAKLAEVDHDTALRLVKFDATLEALARAVADLQAEIVRMRETRLAGGRQR